MTTPRIIVIPGSVRTGSVNAKLADAITKALSDKGPEVVRVSLEDYPMPIYDGNLESEKGVPANALKLGELIAQHHGVVFVCPEYNASISPLLKNTIDWLSRNLGETKPYANRTFALASCSPGALGGIRGLSHTRDVLVSIGADVITPQLAVGPAGDAFDDGGNLKQDRHRAILDKLCNTLIERAAYLTKG